MPSGSIGWDNKKQTCSISILHVPAEFPIITKAEICFKSTHDPITYGNSLLDYRSLPTCSVGCLGDLGELLFELWFFLQESVHDVCKLAEFCRPWVVIQSATTPVEAVLLQIRPFMLGAFFSTQKDLEQNN